MTIGAVNPDPKQPFSLIVGGFYNNGTPILTGTGTYKLSSGNLTVGSGEVVGQGGTGTFKQSSSTNTVGGEFDVGRNGTSNGTFTQSSSSLSVGGNEVVGNFGNATFTSNSSSNSANTITMAQNSGSTATYTLNNSSITATAPAAPANAIWIKGPYTPTSNTNPVSTTGANFLIKGTSTVNGNVTNDCLIKTTSAKVTWNGTVKNNSAYISDPGSTQTFTKDLIVSDTGFLKATAPLTMAGASQDIFIFKENFQITNTNNTNQTNNWDTHNAAMTFVTGGDTTHDLYLVGQDLGRYPTRPVLYPGTPWILPGKPSTSKTVVRTLPLPYM